MNHLHLSPSSAFSQGSKGSNFASSASGTAGAATGGAEEVPAWPWKKGEPGVGWWDGLLFWYVFVWMDLCFVCVVEKLGFL